MRNLSVLVFFAVSSMLAQPVFAEDAVTLPLANESSTKELPTSEKAFVDSIRNFDKKAIIEKLGEPEKADDVRLKGSNKVVASIWQYHNINTAEDGTYYQTTELDFIDDKVVQVVFLNNDGTDKDNGQKYDIAPDPSMMELPPM